MSSRVNPTLYARETLRPDHHTLGKRPLASDSNADLRDDGFSGSAYSERTRMEYRCSAPPDTARNGEVCWSRSAALGGTVSLWIAGPLLRWPMAVVRGRGYLARLLPPPTGKQAAPPGHLNG